MAARYWVGGAATWDGTAGTKWALTSGGAGGQAVPTSSDTVFFDAASGANTVTIGSGTAICSTLTMTGFTGTLAFGTNSITCAGSGTGVFTGATTYSVTGTPLINITGTGTLTLLPASVTEANSISFTINNAASNAIGVSGSVKNLTFAGTYTGNLTNGARTLYGNLTLKSGMTLSAGASVTTFAAASGTQTITSAALNLDFPITFSGTATYQLQDALSVGTATGRTITLTSGTLDLANFTLTQFGQFTSSNSNTRAIAFGTGNLTNTLNGNGTPFFMSVAGGFTYTGTPTLNFTGVGTVGNTRSISFGNTSGGLATNALNFNITAGADTISMPTHFQDFTFGSGFTGTTTSGTLNCYGSIALSANMQATGMVSANTLQFLSTSGTKTITSNGITFDRAITFDGVGGTWKLVGALNVGTATGRAVTLTNGTLDLDGNTFTHFGSFSSSNSNTRTIAFGTGNITNTFTGTSTIFGMTTATNFTYTGTPTVNITGNAGSGITRTITFGNTTGQTEINSLSFTISAGSDTISIGGGFLNLSFAGFTGTMTNATLSIYGNLLFPTGMTLTAGTNTTTFASTNATVRTITTNSNTLDFPITFNGVGGSWRLQDALTVGTNRAITLTRGSFDTNTKSLTCGTFSYNNTNTKTLTLGTSTVTITGGTSTSGFIGSSTGTTYDVANSTIVFTTTGSVVFAGGSSGLSGTLFGTITMSGSGGTLYLGTSTSNTTVGSCTTLNNTVSPCTITNSCTTAFTVTNFNVNGTAGNLVVLNSNTPATARTITKASGTTNVDYLNIQDSTATGGTWNAYGSTNSGNNTGWNFLTRNNGNFLMFF